MKPGDVVLLENLRFHKEEEANDPQFAAQLASLADIYVDDAFGSAHRAHASTAGVAADLPAVAGFLMEKELEFLGKALAAPEHPFVAILGGAKVSDKIGVIENLLGKVDALLIGGGMANTFFKAQGLDVGRSLVEDDKLDVARELLRKGGDKLVLPVDVVVRPGDGRRGRDPHHRGRRRPRRLEDPRHRSEDRRPLQRSSCAVLAPWSGTGRWACSRWRPSPRGTTAVARALAELPGDATTIIGGGDSAAAVEQAGVADRVTHISTGGGASLEFLEGRELPGVEALEDKGLGG